MENWIAETLDRDYQRATTQGEAQLAAGPRAVRARYSPSKARLVVELDNGVTLLLPSRLLQGLEQAKPAQLAQVVLTPLGTGLHWPNLDVDLSVAGLAAGVFGSKPWMRELARHAGKATSAKKSASSRANGKKGGRPKSATNSKVP